MIENKFVRLGMSIGLLLVFVGISIFPGHHALIVSAIMNEPPYPPSNPFPLNRTTNAVVTANLSWMCDDPDGDPLIYDVYFGTTMPPPLVATNLSNSSYDPPGDLIEITTYFWQIVARDTYMNTQPGPLWWFSTGNLPPLTPVFINGPHHVGSNTSVEYTVFAQDPNGHDVFYFFDWGDGNNSGWLGPYAHNELMKAMYTWKFDGAYNVRVKARDFQGLESDWSTPYSVEVSPQMYFENIKSGYVYFQILAGNGYVYLRFLEDYYTAVIVTFRPIYVDITVSEHVAKVEFFAVNVNWGDNASAVDDDGSDGFSGYLDIGLGFTHISAVAYDSDRNIIDREELLPLVLILRKR